MCAGSCGAIQGAKIAHATKRMTSATPMAASGLWRARRVPLLASCQLPGVSCEVVAISVEGCRGEVSFILGGTPHPPYFFKVFKANELLKCSPQSVQK